MINADSVKSRLKNQAMEDGTTMQDKLVTFALERTVYRISISKYADRFTLKGGIFMYALFDGNFTRATVDIDLLARYMSADADQMKELFREIFSMEADDAIHYDIDSLEVKNITELRKYHGVNVSVMAYLGRTRVPVSIDIGFDDVIYPERTKMDFPVLLDMPVPVIYAYSISSVIAEKFEAIVSLGYANSRYKDFYDIYALAAKYDLNGIELQQSVIETFRNRQTEFHDIVAFEEDFPADPTRQKRWDAFIKKKKAMLEISLDEAVKLLKNFLGPVIDSIRAGETFDAVWSADEQIWK